METETISPVVLKATLLDAITFAKFGKHLAPNWKNAKNQVCSMSGQKTNITNTQYLNLIGLIYKDNGLESEFWKTIDKYKAEQYLTSKRP